MATIILGGCGREISGEIAALRADVEKLAATVEALRSLMSQALDSLTASVAKNTTVVGSALTLIQGFSAQLAAAGSDPAALAALQASVDASDTALAAAVVANTPAAPAPAPTS